MAYDLKRSSDEPLEQIDGTYIVVECEGNYVEGDKKGNKKRNARGHVCLVSDVRPGREGLIEYATRTRIIKNAIRGIAFRKLEKTVKCPECEED